MSLLNELKRRNVIRVAIAYLAGAWLLIQILETLFPIFGLLETSIRTVVVAIAVGFVPLLVATWFFELTPEGLKRDGDVSQGDRSSSSARFVDRTIVIVLTLAIGYFAVDKFIFDPARDATEREAALQEGRATAIVESFGDKSIVVLPFANMSSDPEQEFLGDGLAEELLNLLTRIDGLRVISRTSAFSFKGKDVTSMEIASDLNVGYVLEGSVRKSGDALRITAQLIDARVDAHLWSETFDTSVEDIFVIQDEVAAEVVEQLKIRLSVGLPKTTRHHPVAYALFLQARQEINSGRGQPERAEERLLEALQIDPDYLDAKVWLAWVHRLRGEDAEYDGDIETATLEFERAELLISEVESADPDNVQILVWHAWGNMRDVASAAKYVERALAREPTNSEALNVAAVVLTRLWRASDAIPIARYASDRDPLNTHVIWNLARAYLNSGEFALAEETLRAYVAFSPNSVRAPWGIGLSLLLQTNPDQALQYFNNQVANPALRLHGQVLALHDLGRSREADAALDELRGLQGSPEAPGYLSFLIGTAFAWAGVADNAFVFLNKQRESNSSIFRVEADSPLYENLRDDPRWIPFLESVEVAPDVLASVEFNPRLPPGIRMPVN